MNWLKNLVIWIIIYHRIDEINILPIITLNEPSPPIYKTLFFKIVVAMVPILIYTILIYEKNQ